MFYKDDEYIPLKIILLDVPGFYNDYEDNDKTMNFKLDDDNLLGKIIDIFEHIGEKLKIDLNEDLYKGARRVTHILKQKYPMKHV